jgi:hypothetical protein
MSLAYNPFDDFDDVPPARKTFADVATSPPPPPAPAAPAEPDDCPICYMAMSTERGGTGKVTTACGHDYCLKCFWDISTRNAIGIVREPTKTLCPLCRQAMFPPAPAPPPPPPPPAYVGPYGHPPAAWRADNALPIPPGQLGLPQRGVGYRSWVEIHGRRQRNNELVPDPVPRFYQRGQVVTPTRTTARRCQVCHTGWNAGTAGCDIYYQAAYYPTVVDRKVCLKVAKHRMACNDCHLLFSPDAMRGAPNPRPAIYRS